MTKLAEQLYKAVEDQWAEGFNDPGEIFDCIVKVLGITKEMAGAVSEARPGFLIGPKAVEREKQVLSQAASTLAAFMEVGN